MKSIIIILFLALAWNLSAEEIKIKSEINSVTVFQNGAQVNRKGSTTLKSGRNELVFTSLSMYINPQTIQVSGRGNFTILGVYHRINYLERKIENKRIAQMQDSVKMISKKIEYLRKDLNVYAEEANLIKTNKNLTGTQTGLKAADLEAMANFYRKRLGELFTLQLDVNYQIQDLSEINGRLQNQINAITGKPQEAVSEVVVETIADEGGSATVDLSYIVNNANWAPEYDLRAIDVNKPVELHARAVIYQNTGVDWNNVKLTLSTGNPNQSGVIPTLYTWYLNYRTSKSGNALESRGGVTQTHYNGTEAQDDSYAPAAVTKSIQLAGNTSNYTQVVNTQTQTKYEISIPYDVPSSAKRTQVKIQKYELKATYRYYCVPKLDTDVFLQGRITGWEDLNLVAGNINIFFEGTYVTKAYLNPMNFTDTLDISLGRDKSIIVKREVVKDKSGNSLIGATKKTTKAFKITIRNTKSTDITLVVEDHIPLSRAKEIEVELVDKSGAAYEPTTGNLKWDLKLKPRTTETKEFKYTVKYPKDYQILNLE